MGDDPGRRAGIRSLDTGLQLLQLLGDHPSLSVNEAAKLLGTAPSTAHRLLATLKGRGFVAQDDATRRYHAGRALLDIAFDALRNLDVRRVARPHLESLAAEVRETINLIVLEQASIRYVEVVESPERLRVSSRIGETRPAHCTAGGKVLLAALSPAQLDRLYPTEELAPLTSRSFTRRSELLAQLPGIAEQGFAMSVEESIEGLNAVAVAVRDPLHHVVAALAVAAPSARLTGARVKEVVDAATRSAAGIEADLRAAPSGD
jgi:DNA-binding IclR family transcriptional regulator